MKWRDRLTRELLKLVASRVAGCNLCAGHRSQVDVHDVCKSLRFTTRETRRAVKHFCCEDCEASPNLYETLAEWEPDEWADLKRSHRSGRRYGQRLEALVKDLEKTPSLGLLHPSGAALMAAVRRAKVTVVDPGTWWRGCCRDQLAEPPPERFLPADPHQVPISLGRFNHAGQVAHYVGDSPDTVGAELFREEEGELWIAGLQFGRQLRMLDVRITILGGGTPQGLLLAGLNLSLPTSGGDMAPREWILTRLIADLARRRPSVDGILYSSSRRPIVGRNLVLLRAVPVEVVVAPARYGWVWKNYGALFDSIRSHMKAEPM